MNGIMGGQMNKEYTHNLHKEFHSISGRYELYCEGKLKMDGKEILYALGNAVVDSSCCGFWGCRYALVLGYVVKWKYKKNDKGTPISIIEPITDERVGKEVERLLKTGEGVMQVRFC